MKSILTSVAFIVLGVSTSTAQSGATIAGHVVYDGPPVEQKTLSVTTDDDVCSSTAIPDESLLVDTSSDGLKNAVVYLEGVETNETWNTDTDVILDQVGCVFTPHVIILPLGQSMKVRNSDGILHNFHPSGENNRSFNLAMPPVTKEIEIIGRRFRRPDFIRVKCDVHNWMSGIIAVAPDPYYTLPNGQGEFSLSDVPPGTYELVIWHESLKRTSRQITVGPGELYDLQIALGSSDTD